MGFCGFDFWFFAITDNIPDNPDFVVPKALVRKSGDRATGHKVKCANTRIRDGPM